MLAPLILNHLIQQKRCSTLKEKKDKKEYLFAPLKQEKHFSVSKNYRKAAKIFNFEAFLKDYLHSTIGDDS